MDELWHFTQSPDLHEQWDLRFTGIEYLPRPDENEPQRLFFSGIAEVCEWYDDEVQKFKIEVKVKNKVWGDLFGYCGSFEVIYKPVAPQIFQRRLNRCGRRSGNKLLRCNAPEPINLSSEFL